MDDTSRLDQRLVSFEVSSPDLLAMDFPPVLVSSLRRRRTAHRIKAGVFLTLPALALAAALWWQTPVLSPVPLAPSHAANQSILRADPATLPAGADWQPVRLDRAGGSGRLSLDF